MGYGVGNRETVVRFPARVSNFSLLQNVQTGAQVLPASYQMRTWPLSPGKKQPGREVDQSPLRIVKVKNEWNCTSTSPCTFHCLHSNNFSLRQKFTLMFLLWTSGYPDIIHYLSLIQSNVLSVYFCIRLRALCWILHYTLQAGIFLYTLNNSTIEEKPFQHTLP